MKFSFSTDGDNYEGDFYSREAALEAAAARIERGESATVWTAERRAITAASVIPNVIDELVDALGESAYQLGGDAADEWLDTATEPQWDELNQSIRDAFDAWATKHGHQPTWWACADETEHVVVGTAREG